MEARGLRVLRFTNVDFLKDKIAVENSGPPFPEPPSAVRPSLKEGWNNLALFFLPHYRRLFSM